MSIAAAQYDKFREQVATEERVFTFTDGADLLVYPARDGNTVPFWSSQARLVTIQKRLPKYRAYTVTELSLTDFFRRLDRLERDGFLVGVNWSGAALVGYNVPAADLRAALAWWLNHLGKAVPTGSF